MSDIENLKTEIALLKKDAKTGELIHQRLEIAIDKLSEIVISCKQMLAQQEQKLQKAFNLSAQYVGIEPPEVKISRDFDIERLIGQDITALTSLFDQNVIDRDEFRDILVQGEVLPSANEVKSE